ncbi:hypothetical protein GCM10011344_13320 [Dokdonia pacifica]|uniref:Uncharacterized protein n=1 Tax=Dokdonia pacifica TaxID=1627892 RepID=A0A238W9V8_9FLAO|nr:hypothetical protein [Dokdonia pacifica]GGG14013.1 hypothetical protein GCM10011344_13320 [Dokdonia pacifica]SNR43003.1 hypothetical protein SAMN06265376_101818 [Dokdonia pacifica]
MERKTFQTYKKEILEKYQEEKGGEVRSYLIDPTRKRIREACIFLFEKRNEKTDKEILRRFFDFREGEDQQQKIENFHLNKFRPIDNFLKGKTKDPDNICVEMVSWLIDFKPRSYTIYFSYNTMYYPAKKNNLPNSSNSKESILEKSNTPNSIEDPKPIPNDLDNGLSHNKNEDQDFENSPQVNPPQLWKLLLTITTILILIVTITGYFLKDNIQLITSLPSEEQRCMVWNEDHYEEVTPCPLESLARLQEYDKKLIDNFQKIEVNINTQFFYQNGSPRIWYYKKPNGKIDYFTANGFHPIFKKDVKPISQHIINKYVLKSPFNTSFLNTPEKEELALFIFRNDTLDLEIAKRLQKTLFSNYRSTPYLIASKKLNPQIKEHLQQGDLSMYKSDMKKHIDYLCVGTVSYTYRESGVKPKRFACDIQLTYEIFDTQGNPELDKSYSKTITGSGFTKQEAQQNALKKITL